MNAVKPGKIGSHSNYIAYLNKTLSNDYGLAYIEDLQAKKEAEEIKQKTLQSSVQQFTKL